MPHEHFCLKWNNFQKNIVAALGNLKLDEDFVDVTLSCEGKTIKAHKVILSACSDYFRNVFRENPCKHPVIILRDSSYVDIEGLIRYVYRGEVDVQPEQLQSFLRTAELLQIKGLADQNLCNSNTTSDSETAASSPSHIPDGIGQENNAQEDDNKASFSPNSASQMTNFSNIIPAPNVSIQQQRCSSALSDESNTNSQSISAAQDGGNNCANGKSISKASQQPCIKVPVPPTPHLSNLKRNSFTNLAQYLSGSSTYQSATSPASSLSPPPNHNGEQIQNQSNCNVVGVGSVAKRRKTTPKRYKNIVNDEEVGTNNFGEMKNKVVIVGQGQATNFNVKGSLSSIHHYSGSTSSVTASPSSPPHSHSTEGGDHQSALEICEESDRESARSTESSEITLNKSPGSSDYIIRHNLSSLNVNSSIKQYLQQQQNTQIQEFNKYSSALNRNDSNSYQTVQDSEENRLVIQEDDEDDKDNISGHKDVEMDDTATKLVIIKSDNNTSGKRMGNDALNINTTDYGETLDLSRGGKDKKARVEIDSSPKAIHDSEGTNITLCSPNNTNSYQPPRLSNITTIKSANLAPNTTAVPSVSSIITPAALNNMATFPSSPASASVSAAISPSNISQANVLSLPTSISHHIKFKGQQVEALNNQNVSVSISNNHRDASNTTLANNISVSKTGNLPNIPLVVQMPQAHIASQPNIVQDSQNIGIVSGPAISTPVPVSNSEGNKILVQNTTDVATHQQQQQLIAAAMASLSSSIPTAAGSVTQQTSPLSNPASKLISASLANSIYQGDHNHSGVVLIAENPIRCSNPQEVTVLEYEPIQYNHLQEQTQNNRQTISGKTNNSFSSTNNNFGERGGGNSGGGGPAWHGKCPHCHHEYANISSLKYHVRLVHSEANNTICCYLCPQNFSSKLVMREHLYTCHNVKYQ